MIYDKENIFIGSKFGDKFITKCGKIAIFIGDSNMGCVSCAIETFTRTLYYKYDGDCIDFVDELNIISKYHEEIDEDKLNELANKKCNYMLDNKICYADDIYEFYKAGYKDSKEE